MTTRRVRRARRAALVAGLALLLVGVAAGPAAAHAVGTGTEASNYRTTVRGIDQGAPASRCVTVAGEQLELTNRSGQEVLVLGYRLEPYLRVGPAGVFETSGRPAPTPTASDRPGLDPFRVRPGRRPRVAADRRRAVGGSGTTTGPTGPAPTRRP